MSRSTSAAARIFDDAEVRSVLAETFYGPGPSATPESEPPSRPGVAALGARGTRKKVRRPKADHYEILCISMYLEDLARLDEKVALLKGRGHRRMTRSALIRYALDRLSIDDVPTPAY